VKGLVLVTGGAGYIGSHACLALLEAGAEVVVIDDLSNASRESLRRVEVLAGRSLAGFHEIDVRDRAALDAVFRSYAVDTVVHFAGLKAVGESVAEPVRYYDNNVGGALALLDVMVRHSVRRIVFSSSATVYGDPQTVPIREDAPVGPTNPYGRTKLVIEQILADVVASDSRWHVAVLRYFNPVGAHPSGCIGEDPAGTPNNLMPYIAQVAVGRRAELQVFGADYPTADGTGVRDFIHVMDLAEGHVRAVQRLGELPGLTTLNLGTGKGYSVLEAVSAFEAASGRTVPYRIVGRRAGDVAACWADAERAAAVLGWRARRELAEMCADAWRWQQMNPDGYEEQAT
jgi:UDP-glucose 4-epimerase